MVRTEMFLLLGNLLIVYVCPSVAADECQGCNISSACCWVHLNSTRCDTVNASGVQLISSKTSIMENDNITLTCNNNIPDLNVTYWWSKDGNQIDGGLSIVLDNVLPAQKGEYRCCVKTTCGSCVSSSFNVSYSSNSIIILIICGGAALSLVIIVGVAMKIKLKKDNAKHKERMRQRNEQNTPRGY